MTFQLANLTALLLVVGFAGVATVAALLVAGASLAREHRPVRVARHQSIPAYYGHLAFGH